VKAVLDEEHGVMYVYFDDPGGRDENSIKETVADYWPGVNLDVGHDGRPIGLEFPSVERISEEEGFATPPTGGPGPSWEGSRPE
jgi:hypothetical protein